MRRPAALLAVLALAAAAAVLLTRDDDAPRPATIELRPVEPGGPAGVAALTADDGRRRGPLVAYGFTPGSRHRVEASPRCGAAGRPVAELVADPNGAALARLDLPDAADTRALTIRSGPQAESSRVACGGPGTPPLRPRDVALTGPGAGARAQTSALLRLRDGRPVPAVGPLRARAGDTVALAVRADRPDEVAIVGLGLVQQVGPGAIARFAVRVRRPGRYPVRSRLGGEVAVLEVSPRAPAPRARRPRRARAAARRTRRPAGRSRAAR